MKIIDDIDAAIAEHEADQRAYDAQFSRCRSAEPVDTRWRREQSIEARAILRVGH